MPNTPLDVSELKSTLHPAVLSTGAVSLPAVSPVPAVNATSTAIKSESDQLVEGRLILDEKLKTTLVAFAAIVCDVARSTCSVVPLSVLTPTVTAFELDVVK